MRIAIILGPFLPVPPVLGGAVEKVHLALAEAYRDAGHDVTIISRRYGDLPTDEIADGIRHIRVQSADRTANLAANLALGLRYAIRAATALPPADVTITNEFFLPLVLRRRRAGKIYVQVGRYPKGQMFLYSRADRLQAVSHAVGDAIVRQAPWLAPKISVIGYALADDYFAADAEPLPREKTVLYVGRVAKEKGIELLIGASLALVRDIAGALDGWKLRIIGPSETAQGGDGGDYLRQLRAQAEPLGERCEFVGPIFDQSALIRAYRTSSIFVYPSLAELGESFGMAPLEAMASGCATIVSRLRCFDDFIEPGVTGLQFDHRTAHPHVGLAAELSRLITEPELLGRIANAGRDAAARFRTGVIAHRMLADFRSLTGDV